MGFRSSPIAVAVNNVEVGKPATLDILDSGSVTWLGVLNGQVVELQAFTGTLTPGATQPGTPGLLISTGGSGALNTYGAISAFYTVENYKAHYDNGFRLQFRGVWNVDSFVKDIGIIYKRSLAGAEVNQIIHTYSPTLTVTQDTYTDWGILDIAPTGMADTDSLYVCLAAGNDSLFFGWAMLGATVEYRWVDANADPTATAGATVLAGTAAGQVATWDDVRDVYFGGAIAVEGVDVLSTAEGAGDVLTADGAGAATWSPAGGQNEGGVSAYRSTDQTIADSTNTAISFNNELWDTDGYKAAGFTTSIIIPSGKGGKYVVTWVVPWAANATGIRSAYPYNTTQGVGMDGYFAKAAEGSGKTYNRGACQMDLAVGDVIELRVRQTSTGNLDVQAEGALVAPFLQLERIGD